MKKPIQIPTVDVSQAIRIDSVEEEYRYLSRQRCSCGGGLTRDAQALLEIDGKMYDQLSVSCGKCGNQQRLLFDINSFFGKS